MTDAGGQGGVRGEARGGWLMTATDVGLLDVRASRAVGQVRATGAIAVHEYGRRSTAARSSDYTTEELCGWSYPPVET